MRSTDLFRALAGALLVVMAGTAAVQAQSESENRVVSGLRMSGDQPIQIESDKLEVREQENIAIFTGNVTVTQGPTVLKSGRMTVHNELENVQPVAEYNAIIEADKAAARERAQNNDRDDRRRGGGRER